MSAKYPPVSSATITINSRNISPGQLRIPTRNDDIKAAASSGTQLHPQVSFKHLSYTHYCRYHNKTDSTVQYRIECEVVEWGEPADPCAGSPQSEVPGALIRVEQGGGKNAWWGEADWRQSARLEVSVRDVSRAATSPERNITASRIDSSCRWRDLSGVNCICSLVCYPVASHAYCIKKKLFDRICVCFEEGGPKPFRAGSDRSRVTRAIVSAPHVE